MMKLILQSFAALITISLHAGGPLSGWKQISTEEVAQQRAVENTTTELWGDLQKKSMARPCSNNDVRLFGYINQLIFKNISEKPADPIKALIKWQLSAQEVLYEKPLYEEFEQFIQQRYLSGNSIRALRFAWALALHLGDEPSRDAAVNIIRKAIQTTDNPYFLDTNTNSFIHDSQLITAILTADLATVQSLIEHYYARRDTGILKEHQCALRVALVFAFPGSYDLLEDVRLQIAITLCEAIATIDTMLH